MSKQKFNRRQFVKLAGATSAAIPLSSLMGCGTAGERKEANQSQKSVGAKMSNDHSFPNGFFCQAWSY
ncbi:MAG TPA: twin-arginine translocation signal domain-containing protein [Chitinophagaceae bacterium]|nr:twin-arginine translocation signal domain-containing protein [Chitinophagaceae bacterium]